MHVVLMFLAVLLAALTAAFSAMSVSDMAARLGGRAINGVADFVAVLWRHAPRPRRAALVSVALLSLAFGGLAIAGPVMGFFTWSGTGNGRGGQSAARPTCSNDFRGRTWALYGSSSSSSDQFQVCLYTSGGGNAWVAVPR